jgi:hypothetical protein
MLSAFEKMKQRKSIHLLDEEMLNCHSAEGAREIVAGQLILPNELMQKDRADLDDCVFDLLGVNDLDERKQLLKALYRETALYFREGRAVELQAMENRSKSSNKRAHPIDLAEDIWDALDLEDKTPLKEWLEGQPELGVSMPIPEERPVFFPDNPLFELKTVSFGKDGKIQIEYHSKEQAGLVFRVAELGLIGEVKLPSSRRGCADVLKRLNKRFENAQARIKELAESRTTEGRLQNQLVEALERWFVQGHKRSTHEPPPAV